MRLKAIIVSIILGCVSFTSMAQQETSNAGETTDSLDIALAVLWSNSFAEMYQNDPQKADLLFRGMSDAIKMFNSKSIYEQGVMEGFQLIMRSFDMQREGVFIHPERIITNLHAISQGKPVGMDMIKAQQYITNFVNSSKHASPDTVSIASQEEFLNEQLKRESVTKTESGLLFEVLKEGNGESPKSGDKVKILYTGKLSDGTIFDQTTEGPVVFPIDNLVPGFTEGLKLMKTGGRYRMYIPSYLGYGSNNVQGVIPGNSVLDFTVELIEINPDSSK